MSRSKTSANAAPVAGLILLCALACGRDNSHAKQARDLLERIARIDHRAPFAERQAQLDALRALPLGEPDLARTRELCVAAHAGLLTAEREQAEVRARLDAAGGRQLPQDELTRLGIALSQAGERLTKANAALPDCEARTRALLEGSRKGPP
jgi:hypothetical protein